MNFKQKITHNLLNIPGWCTKRHIVVIESDDWGSVRMPSKEVYDKLLNNGIRVDKCHYCKNDSIASEDDLSLLFDVLNSVKDINGNPVKITANSIVANPDFEKIKESDFEEYHYKLITEGLRKIKGCENSLNLWNEGNDKGFFIIQSHGREHLNVSRWMHYLKQNYKETRFAFDLGVYGLSTNITSENRKSFLPAFDFATADEEKKVNLIAIDGLRLFEEIFGFKSTSFIAPNYVWGKSLEKTIYNNGVTYIQGQQVARFRNSTNENNKKRIRYIGKTNNFGQIDLARNCTFEPSENLQKDWISSCLKDIEIAFRWNHPAIICSHRVNYIGTININNRDNGLKQLSILLKEIKKRWPNVEFMSSNELGDLIKKQK